MVNVARRRRAERSLHHYGNLTTTEATIQIPSVNNFFFPNFLFLGQRRDRSRGSSSRSQGQRYTGGLGCVGTLHAAAHTHTRARSARNTLVRRSTRSHAVVGGRLPPAGEGGGRYYAVRGAGPRRAEEIRTSCRVAESEPGGGGGRGGDADDHARMKVDLHLMGFCPCSRYGFRLDVRRAHGPLGWRGCDLLRNDALCSKGHHYVTTAMH